MVIVSGTLEFSGEAIDAVLAAMATVDLGLVHPMTGPVNIQGAQRGDAIEVEIVDIAPDEYGYTVIAPGFGFLRDIFTEPYIVNWRLTRLGAVSPQMPGITVPYEAFPDSIGVLPGDPEIDNILAREAALAGAGGVVLGPSGAGGLAGKSLRQGRNSHRSLPENHSTPGKWRQYGRATDAGWNSLIAALLC